MAFKKSKEKPRKFKGTREPFIESSTWKADPDSMAALSHIEPTQFKTKLKGEMN